MVLGPARATTEISLRRPTLKICWKADGGGGGGWWEVGIRRGRVEEEGELRNIIRAYVIIYMESVLFITRNDSLLLFILFIFILNRVQLEEKKNYFFDN